MPNGWQDFWLICLALGQSWVQDFMSQLTALMAVVYAKIAAWQASISLMASGHLAIELQTRRLRIRFLSDRFAQMDKHLESALERERLFC